MVDETTKALIRDAFPDYPAETTAKAAIKNALDKDPDVLLDFETKFARCFEKAVADAVVDLVAERTRRNLLDQFKEL